MQNNVASIQIQKVAIFNSDRKIINLKSNKSFKQFIFNYSFDLVF